MIALGLIVVWTGYTWGIYGWTLLKGWNIQFRDLANPIHPYQWPVPPKQPDTIPQGQILPGPSASTTAQGGQGSSQRPPVT